MSAGDPSKCSSQVVRLSIDGRDVETEGGKTILEAALDAGIYIPHLCHHPDLRDVGVCRLCVVEIEGREGVATSCTTPAEDGMIVWTKTERLEKRRRFTMELILADHPPDCTVCPKYLNCELQALKQYLGTTEDLRVKRHPKPIPANADNPLFMHDFTRCILCGRCVRACHELRGAGVLSFIGRGKETSIGVAFDRSLVDAGCIFCGACAEVCPTGAVRDHSELLEGHTNRKAALIPCADACPAGIDVPRYVRLIREGDYAAALAVIRERVPFPEVLGNICDHPCETVCRRGELNEAVSIRDLKRFAAEQGGGGWKDALSPAESTGQKVAIVGSGPAGLTAAYYLARLGHGVTVFEALPLAGGMLRVGIPEGRLPRDVLDKEIEDIVEQGVEIKTDTPVESLSLLLDEGYDAVLVTIGTHRGRGLSIPGVPPDKVVIGLDLLRRMNLGQEVDVGKRVLVIGGGNVAFDCANASLDAGAEQVYLACLECREEMPAADDEIEQAEDRGVVTHPAHTVTSVSTESDGTLTVDLAFVEAFDFSEDGTVAITECAASGCALSVDTIVMAIGQIPDIPGGFFLDVTDDHLIEMDPYDGTTGEDGVYAAGDAVTGTASVIKAIAGGREAASAIDRYLGGDGLLDEELAPRKRPQSWLGRDETFAVRARCDISREAMQGSTEGDDGAGECGGGEESVREEAGRCLQCDLRFQISPAKYWVDYSGDAL